AEAGAFEQEAPGDDAVRDLQRGQFGHRDLRLHHTPPSPAVCECPTVAVPSRGCCVPQTASTSADSHTSPNTLASVASPLSCRACVCSAAQSESVIVEKSRWNASRAVLLTHTSVVSPPTTTVRIPRLRSSVSSGVPTKALYRGLVITTSPGSGSKPGAKAATSEPGGRKVVGVSYCRCQTSENIASGMTTAIRTMRAPAAR